MNGPACQQIWVEKYRPKKLEDVVGNQHAVLQLRAFAMEGGIPHLLLSGPPGTGKTTSIGCLVRALLGDQLIERAVVELNASDDRGIDTVRDRIKNFAKEQIKLPPGRTKIVILDEVDSMTEAAQQALRRLMEMYASTTRFALACNTSTRIIEPIQSRCAIVRFSRLRDNEVMERLLYVCDKEKIDFLPDGLEALVFTAEGDMRNALNNLQSTVNGFGLISKENVMRVCDYPPPEKVKGLVQCCLDVNWRGAHDVAEQLVLVQGYSPLDVVGVMKSVMRRLELPEHINLEFLKEIARAHGSMLEGCQTLLQLDRLLCLMCRVCVRTAGGAATPIR